MLCTRPILGFSATNVRYLDNQRDMADELFDGNIASYMTLGDAIVRGILNAPKYVLSVYSCRKSLKKYEECVRRQKSKATRDAAEEYLEELRRSLDKAEGIDEIFKKHITYKNGKKHEKNSFLYRFHGTGWRKQSYGEPGELFLR